MPRAPWEITREMFLSVAETDALLDHVRGQDGPPALLDRLIVETLLFSGLRNSEFCRLHLADAALDVHQPTLKVAGREASRIVYVPLSVCRLLSSYISEVRPGCVPASVAPDDPQQPLIFHERRRPFERTGLYRRVVRILESAGLGSRASVQLLRHTYGYLAYLRTGGNLLFVQRQLGHAHPMITSIYAQFVDESYVDLAARVVTPSARPAVAEPPPAETQTVSRWTNTVEEFQSEYD